MDCVILAAGNGSRLKGLVAEGMKPLLVVDGEALVSRLARQVQAFVEKTVIVVSPVNAGAVSDVVDSNVQNVAYVLQPRAAGPGDALMRGLRACHAQDVLVLASDNIIPDADIRRFMKEAGEAVVVGTRTFSLDEKDKANLVTRVRPDGTTVEHHEPNVNDEWLDSPTGDRYYVGWVGPLLVNRKQTERALWMVDRTEDGEELFIGPYIDRFGETVTTINIDAHDVGVR